jgi:CPA2 family monovalent cation:H+ antiporter-2
MHELPLVSTIAASFAVAWVLGIITHKLRLSPIVGYMLAGIVVGPYTPGFVGDANLASQLAEIGVILLMFGVGLHFHLKDLLNVRRVAIPGAIGQSVIATLLGVVVALMFGWSLKAGIVLGFAMAVASTVVLMRVLADNDAMDTTAGHVVVGWLIVEDLLTVIVLVLIPSLDTRHGGSNVGMTLLWAMLKLGALVAILLLAGSKVIPRIMVAVAKLRSRELFTLTVLVMAIAIATGAAYFFGASMALGAFLAGMVVGQSPVSQQAAADALPLRDAFAVLFFTSVGMLFDPRFLWHEPGLIIACLAVVMIGKPIAALGIVAVLGYPLRTGITVALGLAQIGEFSFILAELGHQHELLPDAGHNVLVACAIVSITLSPLLFRMEGWLESTLRGFPRLYNLLTYRSRRMESRINEHANTELKKSEEPLAVVLGYGPVGQSVDQIIRESGLRTLVVDMNMDTVERLKQQNRLAIYGDAYNIEVLAEAMTVASHIIITLPHAANRNQLIAAAKLINPAIRIFVRTRYVAEKEELIRSGVDGACFEEAEVASALAKLVLRDRGASAEHAEREGAKIRSELIGGLI